MRTTWVARDGRAEWGGRLLADWVPDLVREVVAAVNPEAVWLFGSVARGDDNGDSDIDLLVVLPRFEPGDALDLKRVVHSSVTVPVPFDVSFTDPRRLSRRAQIAGTLERAAVSEGRLVHERG